MNKGYGIVETGLVPVYPEGYACSPLTSLYASLIDNDGGPRDEKHTGVDGGRLGEDILAPAAGTVIAAWKSNWGWGPEGSLLIRHDPGDVNVDDGAPLYLSVFDHLSIADMKRWSAGDKVTRGQRLARVDRPGGKARFLPEVHWEVWEADDDTLTWQTNRYGGNEWVNATARLIDPLYILGLANPPADGVHVEITPFESCTPGVPCRGFTYILPCRKTP